MIPFKYVIVSPVRDEQAYLHRTIESVSRQTVRPQEWVIVNDGSTDATASIIDGVAKAEPWIRPLHRINRGYRKAGGGVVEAFNAGYGTLQSDDWEFIVKLDGDLSFDPRYFEECWRRFKEDQRLGIAGGSIYHIIDGKQVLE